MLTYRFITVLSGPKPLLHIIYNKFLYSNPKLSLGFFKFVRSCLSTDFCPRIRKLDKPEPDTDFAGYRYPKMLHMRFGYPLFSFR